MRYYFSKVLDLGFDEAINTVTNRLKDQGFGILTEIDVQNTMKQKLDVDFRRYKILGACNPPFAHKALTAENKIGTMLPCNVIVQETDDNRVEVAAIDPIASMASVQNEQLEAIAKEVSSRLKSVIEAL